MIRSKITFGIDVQEKQTIVCITQAIKMILRSEFQ